MWLLQLATPAPPPPPFSHPTDMLNMFRVATQSWGPALLPVAKGLLFTIGTIDLAWTCSRLAVEGADMQQYIAAIIRRIMAIGFWLAIILHLDWMQDIVDSFVKLAQMVSHIALDGYGAITPSSLFADGFSIAGALDDAANKAGFLTDVAIAIAFHIDAWMIIIAYIILVLSFIVFEIQMYVSMTGGYIFTGFGGSSWTMPYAERYIAMVLSAGFRLFLFFLIVGMAHTLANTWWIPGAENITKYSDPLLTAIEISAEVILFCFVCWLVPALASHIMSGALAAGGEHLTSFLSPGIQAGIAGTSMAINAVTAGAAMPATAAVSTVAGAGGYAASVANSRGGAPSQPAP